MAGEAAARDAHTPYHSACCVNTDDAAIPTQLPTIAPGQGGAGPNACGPDTYGSDSWFCGRTSCRSRTLASVAYPQLLQTFGNIPADERLCTFQMKWKNKIFKKDNQLLNFCSKAKKPGKHLAVVLMVCVQFPWV